MLVMRAFEEAVGEACVTGEIHGEMHLATGQEAIAAALEPLLQRGDVVVSTHRPHLHALASGVDPVAMLAEILERDGLCHGKGGHMHLFDPEHGFMSNGIVGAGAPMAAGYAFAQLREGSDAITLCVLGDGAMNQGAFFETANLAALWRLPVVFLCEDNGYGISVPKASAAAGSLVSRGECFGIPAAECDGSDPLATFEAIGQAFVRARSRIGPSLVVAACYRYRGHYEGDLDRYRSDEEKAAAMSDSRDPILRLSAVLLQQGIVDSDEVDALAADARGQIDAWMAAARARDLPSVEFVRESVFV